MFSAGKASPLIIAKAQIPYSRSCELSCVNTICYASFPQCPLCAMPVNASEITPANFLNQLFKLGLQLQEDIKKLDATRVDSHKLCDLFEPDEQKRTVEDFCATQKDVGLEDYVGEDVAGQDLMQAASEEGPSAVLELVAGGATGSSLDAAQRSSKTLRTQTDVVISGRGTKRKAMPMRPSEIEKNLLFPPLNNDSFLFSQNPTQHEPMPQMTQQFPVFEEPERLCFFQQKPKKTFADRIMFKAESSSSGPKKRNPRISGKEKSPEIF
ncbi:unnamed protein product [Enterobius vermicularis]|uniref:Uncharacterized protein n=1 Tax=Enterobius vermicularis TaxID=51028 RepID=A0A0N4VJU8_ENTVE|nr:unnamed protein product [Enterobius vermicularis]